MAFVIAGRIPKKYDLSLVAGVLCLPPKIAIIARDAKLADTKKRKPKETESDDLSERQDKDDIKIVDDEGGVKESSSKKKGKERIKDDVPEAPAQPKIPKIPKDPKDLKDHKVLETKRVVGTIESSDEEVDEGQVSGNEGTADIETDD